MRYAASCITSLYVAVGLKTIEGKSRRIYLEQSILQLELKSLDPFVPCHLLAV